MPIRSALGLRGLENGKPHSRKLADADLPGQIAGILEDRSCSLDLGGEAGIKGFDR
jgi:hypothetical protein